jgi:hypothetical protein
LKCFSHIISYVFAHSPNTVDFSQIFFYLHASSHAPFTAVVVIINTRNVTLSCVCRVRTTFGIIVVRISGGGDDFFSSLLDPTPHAAAAPNTTTADANNNDTEGRANAANAREGDVPGIDNNNNGSERRVRRRM